MANSRRELESVRGTQGIPDVSAIKPITPLQRMLAHQYDLRPREKVFLGDGNGGIRRAFVRSATQEEVSIGINGGQHNPIDVSPPKKKKLSHGDYVRASKQSMPVFEPEISLEADYRRAKTEREARKAAAKALRSKGNKARKSA